MIQKYRYELIILAGLILLLAAAVNYNALREISIKHEDKAVFSNGIKIEGTLDVPDKKSFPAVLFIAGSGPTDRDGNSRVMSSTTKGGCLKMLGTELALKGIASLRYDKRTLHASMKIKKPEPEELFELMVKDAVTWITELKKDRRITSVSVLGHSQGALIAVLAAQREKVATVISAAGAARPILKVTYDQFSQQPESIREEAQSILKTLMRGMTTDNISQPMAKIFSPYNQRFIMTWNKIDPAAEIKKLTVPVLLISGTSDIQVPVSETKILKKAKPDSVIKIIPSMNHVLKQTPENRALNIAAYTDPHTPLSKKAVREITDFILKNSQ